MGFFGFLYARGIMLNEWKEASLLRLQRAAHYVDMRLSKPIDWIEMFNTTGEMEDAYAVQQWIVQRLKTLEGVTEVHLKWTETVPEPMPYRGMGGMGAQMPMGGMMHFHRGRISDVTPPLRNAKIGKETISLISQFVDKSGRLVGSMEVGIRFEYLLEDIKSLGWWQSNLAGLIDESGRYIAHTKTMEKTYKGIGQNSSPLELSLLKEMKKKPYGTLFGPGHPPKMVCGFYRLKNAPWTIVVFAEGKKILAPIVRFRFYYFVAGSLCIIFILLLIRFVVGRPARIIRDVAAGAQKVAGGVYADPLPVKSGDEIGQLTQSFNTMIKGLKERDFIRNTFGRYVDQEIARDLMRRPEATRLGGEKRVVAILMSDLRNFTPLSEALSPEETIGILNRYFSHMISVIQRDRGIIVDFFGDALLVFFDPMNGRIEHTSLQAIHCALEMQREIAAFNTQNKADGLPELQMGIAVNAGEVIVGNIGSDTRAKYGIVGAPVNLTNRIQAVAEADEVVVSDFIYRYVKDSLLIRRSFETRLKGIYEPVRLYVVGGLRDVSDRASSNPRH
jgi:adenylate cyclase